MEREKEVKITYKKLAGRFLLSVLFLLFLVPSLFGQTNKILLTEKPWELEIYNNYKEKLKLNEKEKILPYTPFTLSDFDFSQPLIPLRKVTINNSIFYLEVNSRKKIINISKAGKSILISGYKAVSPETFLQLTRNKSFYLPTGKKVIIKKGEVIKLLFTKRKKHLAFRLSQPSYGFIYLSKTEIEKLKLKEQIKKLSKEIENEVISDIEEYNRKISDLVTELDSAYSKNVSPPQWVKVKSSDYLIDFVFTNAKTTDFPESIKKLKSKIEILLIGKKYKANLTNNHLIIEAL